MGGKDSTPWWGDHSLVLRDDLAARDIRSRHRTAVGAGQGDLDVIVAERGIGDGKGAGRGSPAMCVDLQWDVLIRRTFGFGG